MGDSPLTGAFPKKDPEAFDRQDFAQKLYAGACMHDSLVRNVTDMLDHDEITTAAVEAHYFPEFVGVTKEYCARRLEQEPALLVDDMSARDAVQKYWIQFATETLLDHYGLAVSEGEDAMKPVIGIPADFTSQAAYSALENLRASCIKLHEIACECLGVEPDALDFHDYLEITSFAQENKLNEDVPFKTWFTQAQALLHCDDNGCVPS